MLKDMDNNNVELNLRKASAEAEIGKVVLILKQKNKDFNINSVSSNGNTALHWAVKRAILTKSSEIREKYETIIEILIQHKADDLAKNKENKNPHEISRESSHLSKKLLELVINREVEQLIFISKEAKTAFLGCCIGLFQVLETLEVKRSLANLNHSKLTVVSLGCGYAYEAIPLSKYFGMHGKNIQYIGIDNNQEIIQENTKMFKHYPITQFLQGDATKLEQLLPIKLGSIDFGVLLHGDFTRSRQTVSFAKMINNTFPKLLRPNAHLLMTFYSEKEFNECSRLTENMKAFYKPYSRNYYTTGLGWLFATLKDNLQAVYPLFNCGVILATKEYTASPTHRASLNY